MTAEGSLYKLRHATVSWSCVCVRVGVRFPCVALGHHSIHQSSAGGAVRWSTHSKDILSRDIFVYVFEMPRFPFSLPKNTHDLTGYGKTAM